MKKIIKNLALLAFAGVLFTACDDDDVTGESLLNFSTVPVTLTSDMNNITVDESTIDTDNPPTITVTATIAEPTPVTLRIPLEAKAGSTADGSDYTTHEIVIPALQTSATTTVVIEKTGDIEGNETLMIVPGASPNLTTNAFELVVNIENDWINDVLDLTLSWDGEFVNGDVTLSSICDIDYDLLLADGTGALLGYIVGTGACPEHGTVEGLADGTYYILADLYDNPFSGLGFTDAIPLTLEYSQEFFPNTTGTITNTSQNLSLPGDPSGGFAYLTGMAIMEVVDGYNYTLSPL